MCNKYTMAVAIVSVCGLCCKQLCSFTSISPCDITIPIYYASTIHSLFIVPVAFILMEYCCSDAYRALSGYVFWPGHSYGSDSPLRYVQLHGGWLLYAAWLPHCDGCIDTFGDTLCSDLTLFSADDVTSTFRCHSSCSFCVYWLSGLWWVDTYIILSWLKPSCVYCIIDLLIPDCWSSRGSILLSTVTDMIRVWLRLAGCQLAWLACDTFWWCRKLSGWRLTLSPPLLFLSFCLLCLFLSLSSSASLHSLKAK